jgi:hypothetical protein
MDDAIVEQDDLIVSLNNDEEFENLLEQAIIYKLE